MAQSLLNPPVPPVLLSIDTNSTLLNSQGRPSDEDIDKLFTTVTPEGCTLVHDKTTDDLNLSSRGRFDAEVCNFKNSSGSIPSKHTHKSDDNGTGDVGIIVDTLTIDTKPALETRESLNPNYPHTISPHESTPVNMDASSMKNNAAISPQPAETSQLMIHDNNENADATTEEIALPRTMNSKDAGTSPPYPLPRNSFTGSHHSEPPPPPPAPALQPSAAQEALLTLRNTRSVLRPAPLPLPLIRGVSLDSGNQYPHHLNNNTHILDAFEHSRNDSDNESSLQSENTSSDGEGSYFSEHLPSPKSHRHSAYGNRLPPGQGSNGGGGFVPPGPYWNRSTRGLSDGGGSRNCPSTSNNLSRHLHNKFGQESDLSLSSSSAGDDGSVSTLGNAYPLSRTNTTPNPFTTYRLDTSNTGYGAVGEHFRNPSRPPMMPLTDSKNDTAGRNTLTLLPRLDSMEPADDLPVSLTTTPSSHATSSETGNISSCKSDATKPRRHSTNSSIVSSGSDYLGLPSLQSGTNGRDAKNGDAIANMSVVNVVGRVGLQPNDNVRNSAAGTTHNNFKSGNANNDISKNKQHHRRQRSYCGSTDTGYKPDNSELPHLQQQKHHKQRSNQILNPPPCFQDESDCDTAASEMSIDPPNYLHGKNRSRSHSDFGDNGQLHSRVDGCSGGHVPIEVKAPSISNGRRGNGGGRIQQSQINMENRVSPHRKDMTERQKEIWRKGQSSMSPNRPPHSPSYASPDRNLIKSNDTIPKSSNGSILVYSEDDTDESTRFREMSAIAEKANRVAGVSPGGAGDDRKIHTSSSERATPRDMVIQTHSPASDVHSKTMEKADQAASLHSVEYDMSGATSRLQQSDTGGTLYQEHYSGERPEDLNIPPPTNTYKLYGKRWIMLFWMSLLNLLSDWTCYSVAPISFLTKQKFNGTVNPEALVTLFLAANSVATALEPRVLARLGLRRTIIFGAFLLMVGNIVKSGGIPGLTDTAVEGQKEWRIYTGFLIVGLSQPLYQCTPALLSSSWFADKERTLATGVALNANQVGIGVSFIVGTTMVASVDDISTYFNLLSFLSILAFFGCFFQFSDAPPTPPSGSARIMRGSLDENLVRYGMDYVRQSMSMGGLRSGSSARWARSRDHGRNLHPSLRSLETSSKESSSSRQSSAGRRSKDGISISKSRNSNSSGKYKKSKSISKSSDQQRHNSPTNTLRHSSSKQRQQPRTSHGSSSGERGSRHVRRNSGGGTRHRSSRKSGSRSAASENGFGSNHIAPSPTSGMESTADCLRHIASLQEEAAGYGAVAPSSMMSSERGSYRGRSHEHDATYYDTSERIQNWQQNDSHRSERLGAWPNESLTNYTSGQRESHNYHRGGDWPQREQYYGGQHYGMPPNEMVGNVGGGYPPDASFPSLRHESNPLSRGNPYQHSYAPYEYRNTTPLPIHPYIGQYPYQVPPSNWQGAESYYNYHQSVGGFQYHRPGAYLEPLHPLIPNLSNRLPPPESEVDIGAEPVVTQLEGGILNIEIRDDQVLQSIKACFSRPGFVHAVVAFAVGGVVINTLSTYMDYLVRLGGSDRTIVGIVGFFFQMLIMISGMVVGKLTDKTRAYYNVVLGLLFLGAMILAECGVHLDADEGVALRWSLLGAAIMVGPLQPVATELGVDVVYPLSENTVLVIQQLFSNLLSALFIPFFRSVRDVGVDDGDINGRPQYTFSLYLLILMHATGAVIFSTFNGKYVRLEHEEDKKNQENQARCTSGSDKKNTIDTDISVDSLSIVVQSSSQKTQCNDEEEHLLGTHK